MHQINTTSNELVLFKPSSGDAEFQAILDGKEETIWGTQQQMMDLFGKARRTILNCLTSSCNSSFYLI